MPITAQSEFTPEEVRELRGGWAPLLARVGQPAGLASAGELAAAWPLSRVDSVPALRLFLRAYVTEILLPLELPATARAFAQAQRNELRELLATTLALGEEARLREFAAASQRVGRAQLQRLRPLTDQRLAGTMQLADRRRPGSSRRWKSVRSILTRVFGSPFSEPISPRKMRASAPFGRCEPPRRRRSYCMVPAKRRAPAACAFVPFTSTSVFGLRGPSSLRPVPPFDGGTGDGAADHTARLVTPPNSLPRPGVINPNSEMGMGSARGPRAGLGGPPKPSCPSSNFPPRTKK